MKYLSLLPAVFFIFSLPTLSHPQSDAPPAKPIRVAVEFMDHAACAYIARAKGWFEEEGLNLAAYDSYVTGMALAAALARDDIDAAYLCLVPAINVYANAGVPVKIVAGTHKYGYGLVVDPRKVKSVGDLEKPDIRIGCVREGGAVDILFNRVIDRYHLDRESLRARTLRMNPPRMVIALKTGRLDAAFLPEHFATLAESLGFSFLLESKKVRPGMQGSVLVVKEKLIRDDPKTVESLVAVSEKATRWLRKNPREAARLVADELQGSERTVFPKSAGQVAGLPPINPEVIERSMDRMIFTTDIKLGEIQQTIDYLYRLGYIPQKISAGEITEMRFIRR